MDTVTKERPETKHWTQRPEMRPKVMKVVKEMRNARKTKKRRGRPVGSKNRAVAAKAGNGQRFGEGIGLVALLRRQLILAENKVRVIRVMIRNAKAL